MKIDIAKKTIHCDDLLQMRLFLSSRRRIITERIKQLPEGDVGLDVSIHYQGVIKNLTIQISQIDDAIANET